jgi:hypothetical protein
LVNNLYSLNFFTSVSYFVQFFQGPAAMEEVFLQTGVEVIGKWPDHPIGTHYL